MKKTIYFFSLLFFVSLIFITGCNKGTEPEIIPVISSQMQIVNAYQKTRLETAGIDPNSVSAFFSLGWTVFTHGTMEKITSYVATASAYDRVNTSDPINMGDVFVLHNQVQYPLIRASTPEETFFLYYSTGSDDINDSSATTPRFVAADNYTFTISGNDNFTLEDIQLTAPAAPMEITAPAKFSTISLDNPLTIKWNPIEGNGKIFLLASRSWNIMQIHTNDIWKNEQDNFVVSQEMPSNATEYIISKEDLQKMAGEESSLAKNLFIYIYYSTITTTEQNIGNVATEIHHGDTIVLEY